MQKDAIELIQQTALKARPRWFRPDCEPPGVYYLDDPDGTRSRLVVAERHPIAYRALTMADFAALVRRYRKAPPPKIRVGENGYEAAEPVLERTNGPTLAMVGTQEIVAVLDENSPGDRVRFAMTWTQPFATLKKSDERRLSLPQADFINLLRIDLAGAVDAGVIGAFRLLKFQKSAASESQVNQSNKAISSAVKMDLAAGGGAIPDEIVCGFAVYEEFPQFGVSVKCAVCTNIDEASFTLIPLAGELNRAEVMTRVAIAGELVALLDGSGAEVFCGMP